MVQTWPPHQTQRDYSGRGRFNGKLIRRWLMQRARRIFCCRRMIRCCIESRMFLGKIQIFPIKSLDGVLVGQAQTTVGGILENDRTIGCGLNAAPIWRKFLLRHEKEN